MLSEIVSKVKFVQLVDVLYFRQRTLFFPPCIMRIIEYRHFVNDMSVIRWMCVTAF
jgi:hypothetical protein